MKKISVYLLIVLSLIALFFWARTSLGSKEENNDSKKLIDLPLHEQLAHKSLMKRLKLLHIHLDHNHRQSNALLKLMELLEDNKDAKGFIDKEHLLDLIELAAFPKLEMMKSELEEISDNPEVEHQANYCLDLIAKEDKEAVTNWFQFLAKDIRAEIDTYEESTMSFPQYRYMLELYDKSISSLAFQAQMLLLMNPNVIKSTNTEQ